MKHLAGAGGLVFESDIPLPGLCPARGPASIFVSLGAVEASSPSVEWIQHWTRGDGIPWLACGRVERGYLLRFVDTADVSVDIVSRKIVCDPLPHTSIDALGLVVCGQVVPRLLSLDGTPVLHASAVAIDGGAVVLAAESGAGKSTLAAALCRAGGALLADDFVALEASGEDFLCRPTSTVVNLAAAARQMLGCAENRVRPPVPAATPVRAIYLLNPAGGGPPAVEPLQARDAFVRLFRLSYRMGSTDRATVTNEFAHLAAAAAAVPVRQLRLPHGPDRLRASVDAVLRGAPTGARL